jgi:NAD(P)H-flavin reductase
MAAWGPEPIWKGATVLDNVPACVSRKSTSLVLEVDDETARQYTIPGQYVQVRLNDDTKPLFLAMASAPPNADAEEGASSSSCQFEFLVKKTTGNDWITGLTKGATLEMSQVLGNGFNVQDNLDGFKYDFPTQNILLFATGSGIAPIKAAMECPGFLSSGGRTCRLYYGEQTKDDLCFTTLFSLWEERGYQVVPVLSQEETPSNNGLHRCGYVQNALEEDGVAIPRNSGALLCGQKNMAESVSEILKTAGVFEGRILTNF